jgi:DNA-binding PadR family transcriptional regulator
VFLFFCLLLQGEDMFDPNSREFPVGDKWALFQLLHNNLDGLTAAQLRMMLENGCDVFDLPHPNPKTGTSGYVYSLLNELEERGMVDKEKRLGITIPMTSKKGLPPRRYVLTEHGRLVAMAVRSGVGIFYGLLSADETTVGEASSLDFAEIKVSIIDQRMGTLEVLRRHGSLYGAEVAQKIVECAGRRRVCFAPPGSLYSLLTLLIRGGLVQRDAKNSQPLAVTLPAKRGCFGNRQYFSLTPDGTRYAEQCRLSVARFYGLSIPK